MARSGNSKMMTLSRLRTLKTVLLSIAREMGTSSPEKALQKFIDEVQKASPQLKSAILFMTPWALLITAVSKYALIRRTVTSIRNYATSSLYSSVSIPGNHPLNKQVLAYMVEHGLGKNARTLALTSPTTAGSRPYGLPYDDYGYLYGSDSRRARAKRNLNAEEEDRQKQALSYVPEIGSYRFWWKWYPMTFERQRHSQQHYDTKGRLTFTSTLKGDENINISCPSFLAGPRPIQEFLDHVKAAPAKDNTTTIYRPDGPNSTWDAGITRPSRNLNAVTLDAHVKEGLVSDIETYLAPETRKYYANRGIPWRRGFLFYGNPGTGKTSFTNALAGHLHLNIYMISLSSNNLNDTILESLFEQLPSRCIVLLEDIDSAGIQRENMKASKASKRKHRQDQGQTQQQYYDVDGNPIRSGVYSRPTPTVTLSGLLNVLDGIHSKEGHVTIMTSNSPDSLDSALIRPGRIDRKVLFGYASSEVIKKLFVHIFSKSPEELLEGEKVGQSEYNIQSLAEAFAEMVPADKLTPAEVQGYLLVHRDDPNLAVEEAAAWALKTISTKEKGANVETFAGQEGTEEKDKKNKKSSTKRKTKKTKSTEEDKAGAKDHLDDSVTPTEDEEGCSNDSSHQDEDTDSQSTPPSSNASTTSLSDDVTAMYTQPPIPSTSTDFFKSLQNFSVAHSRPGLNNCSPSTDLTALLAGSGLPPLPNITIKQPAALNLTPPSAAASLMTGATSGLSAEIPTAPWAQPKKTKKKR